MSRTRKIIAIVAAAFTLGGGVAMAAAPAISGGTAATGATPHMLYRG